MNRVLDERQEKFVTFYVATGNASKSADMAGYSHPKQKGYDLKKRFAPEIEERTREQVSASVLYSVAAASLAVPVALVLGHAIARGRWTRLLEPLVVLPLAGPAILFGIGNISLWSHDWSRDFYAGPGLVVLMLVGRYLAFPTLVGAGATASLDPRLEEAAPHPGASARTRGCERQGDREDAPRARRTHDTDSLAHRRLGDAPPDGHAEPRARSAHATRAFHRGDGPPLRPGAYRAFQSRHDARADSWADRCASTPVYRDAPGVPTRKAQKRYLDVRALAQAIATMRGRHATTLCWRLLPDKK